MTLRCLFFAESSILDFVVVLDAYLDINCVCMYFLIGMNRDLKVDGCPLKENLFRQPALLMNAKCIALP